MEKIFFSFLLFFNLTLSAGEVVDTVQTAEEDLVPLNFSEETIERFKEDPDYDYSEATADEHWWTKFKRYLRLQWQRFMNWLFGDYEAPLLLAIFLDILPYLLLGLLFTLVLYLFTKLNPGTYIFGTPATGELHFTEEEKIIKSRDILKLIEKAAANGNYRLAVRYHFLYILQQLSKQELVIYNAAKTDEEYVLEVEDPDLRFSFKKLIRIYDYVWYGDFVPDAASYERIRSEFSKALLLIPSRHEQSL